MTICNMSIEGGARAGMISPQSERLLIVKEAKRIKNLENLELLIDEWKNLASDKGSI